MLTAYATGNEINQGAIFVGKNGKPIHRTTVWREMKALCKTANISPSKVFPHNLRHVFAKVFYKLEKDIAKLADILGHSSINTTRIYIMTTGDEHRKKNRADETAPACRFSLRSIIRIMLRQNNTQ